jgi:tetratricopeptide (TPR) repeat protein
MEDRRSRRVAERLRCWLRRERGTTLVRDVGRLSDEALGTLASLTAEWITPEAVETMLARSTARLGRKPSEAVSLARAAAAFARHAPAASAQASTQLQGDSWRQYALALADCGDYAEAIRACGRADMLYETLAPEPLYEQALVSLTRGRALCYLGHAKESLAIIGAAAETLRPLNTKKYVSARTMYATALAAMDRYAEAATVFADAAVMAGEDDDTLALAFIVNNIGFCYASIGNLPLARESLDHSLVQFQQLGLRAQIPRNRTAYVKILIQEGRYNKAISDLFEIRRTFLDELDMPVLAADTGLWLLEVLYLAGREKDVPSLSSELVDVFRQKNLPREAGKALAYLKATGSGPGIEDVRYVRDFFLRLQASADAVFQEG